jgi:hypothetical protein
VKSALTLVVGPTDFLAVVIIIMELLDVSPKSSLPSAIKNAKACIKKAEAANFFLQLFYSASAVFVRHCPSQVCYKTSIQKIKVTLDEV